MIVNFIENKQSIETLNLSGAPQKDEHFLIRGEYYSVVLIIREGDTYNVIVTPDSGNSLVRQYATNLAG